MDSKRTLPSGADFCDLVCVSVPARFRAPGWNLKDEDGIITPFTAGSCAIADIRGAWMPLGRLTKKRQDFQNVRRGRAVGFGTRLVSAVADLIISLNGLHGQRGGLKIRAGPLNQSG